MPISNASSYFGRKEIKELPNILSEGEVLDNIIQGVLNGGVGILVSTNRRLIFIDKGFFFGLKVVDYPLDKITSIQYEAGILFGTLKIVTSGSQSQIENVPKKEIRHFAEFVRNKIAKGSSHSDNAVLDNSIINQLEKLVGLRDKGILTEEEFIKEKSKLLK